MQNAIEEVHGLLDQLDPTNEPAQLSLSRRTKKKAKPKLELGYNEIATKNPLVPKIRIDDQLLETMPVPSKEELKDTAVLNKSLSAKKRYRESLVEKCRSQTNERMVDIFTKSAMECGLGATPHEAERTVGELAAKGYHFCHLTKSLSRDSEQKIKFITAQEKFKDQLHQRLQKTIRNPLARDQEDEAAQGLPASLIESTFKLEANPRANLLQQLKRRSHKIEDLQTILHNNQRFRERNREKNRIFLQGKEEKPEEEHKQEEEEGVHEEARKEEEVDEVTREEDQAEVVERAIENESIEGEKEEETREKKEAVTIDMILELEESEEAKDSEPEEKREEEESGSDSDINKENEEPEEEEQKSEDEQKEEEFEKIAVVVREDRQESRMAKKFMEDEAELGSDNEEHDYIVKRADGHEEQEGQDLDRDLPGLINDEVKVRENERAEMEQLYLEKQMQDEEQQNEEIMNLVLGKKREEQCLKTQAQFDKQISMMWKMENERATRQEQARERAEKELGQYIMKHEARNQGEASQDEQTGYDSDIARKLQERHAKLVMGKRKEVKPSGKVKSNAFNPPARVQRNHENFQNFRRNQSAKVSESMTDLESDDNGDYEKESRDCRRAARREKNRKTSSRRVQSVKTVRKQRILEEAQTRQPVN